MCPLVREILGPSLLQITKSEFRIFLSFLGGFFWTDDKKTTPFQTLCLKKIVK